MKFAVSQEFDAPSIDVLDLYSSSELYEALPDFERISRPEILDRTKSGDRVVMRLRYRFTAELPAAALAVIDPDRLTWIEETTYDLGRGTASIRLLPDHYASKMTATAEARITPQGAGSNRSVSGDLRVRIFLVAGQVERAIVSGLREHLDEEAVLVARLLAPS